MKHKLYEITVKRKLVVLFHIGWCITRKWHEFENQHLNDQALRR